MVYVFEGVLPAQLRRRATDGDDTNAHVEDGGQAFIAEMNEPVDSTEGRLFVRLMSWDESALHPEIVAMLGKKVRVTLEVVPE